VLQKAGFLSQARCNFLRALGHPCGPGRGKGFRWINVLGFNGLPPKNSSHAYHGCSPELGSTTSAVGRGGCSETRARVPRVAPRTKRTPTRAAYTASSTPVTRVDPAAAAGMFMWPPLMAAAALRKRLETFGRRGFWSNPFPQRVFPIAYPRGRCEDRIYLCPDRGAFIYTVAHSDNPVKAGPEGEMSRFSTRQSDGKGGRRKGGRGKSRHRGPRVREDVRTSAWSGSGEQALRARWGTAGFAGLTSSGKRARSSFHAAGRPEDQGRKEDDHQLANDRRLEENEPRAGVELGWDQGTGPTGLPPPLRTARVNTVFQDYALFPHIDLGDNVNRGACEAVQGFFCSAQGREPPQKRPGRPQRRFPRPPPPPPPPVCKLRRLLKPAKPKPASRRPRASTGRPGASRPARPGAIVKSPRRFLLGSTKTLGAPNLKKLR